MKAASIQPEKEIEEVWLYFRVSQEFDENPLKKMYNFGGAYFGAPKTNQNGIGSLESTLSGSYSLKGATIYGSNSKFSAAGSGLSTTNPAASYNSYFMKGAKSYSGSLSSMGKAYASSSASYAGGKGSYGGASTGGGK